MAFMKWSFSKMDTYLQCKRKFKNVYLDNRGGEIKSDAMAIGEGMHAFLEAYACNHHLANDIVKCRKIFHEAALNAKSLVTESEPFRCLHLVDSYIAHQKPLTPMIIDGRPAVERYFKLDLGEGLICSGKIDIITVNGSVTDYKTASKPYTPEDVRGVVDGKGLQLSIYAAAYRQWFGKVPNKVGFQVITKNSDPPQNIGVVRTNDQLDETVAFIKHVDKTASKESQWACANSKWPCRWCDFKDDPECGR